VLAAAIACVFLTVLLSAGLVTSALRRHRQLERQVQDVQAVWLAESGMRRAAAQLANNPDYKGETWIVPAEELGRTFAGRVVIGVSTAEDNPSRHVTVEAFYPDDPVNRTRVAKVIEWTP
jgi:hypothetical protein